MNTFLARLAGDSPLIEVFKTGRVPLTALITSQVLLEGHEGPQNVYHLDLKRTTVEEKDALARLMADERGATYKEARRVLEEEADLPLRVVHIASVEVPLRFVL